MTRKGERRMAIALWTLYGVLAVGGLGLLAEALFVPRRPREIKLQAPPATTLSDLKPAGSRSIEALAAKRMTRVLARAVSATPAAGAAPVPLESIVKLTGILDFGGKSPSIAVIETRQESKGYKVGDAIGETGAVVRTVTDCVVLEFAKKRYKLTFKGVEELPANALGSKE